MHAHLLRPFSAGCFPAHPRKPRAGPRRLGRSPIHRQLSLCLGYKVRRRILGYHRLQAEVANPAVLRAGLTSAHVTNTGTLASLQKAMRGRRRREEGSGSGCVVRVCGRQRLTRSVGRHRRGFVGPVPLPAPRSAWAPPPVSGSGVTAVEAVSSKGAAPA